MTAIWESEPGGPHTDDGESCGDYFCPKDRKHVAGGCEVMGCDNGVCWRCPARCPCDDQSLCDACFECECEEVDEETVGPFEPCTAESEKEWARKEILRLGEEYEKKSGMKIQECEGTK